MDSHLFSVVELKGHVPGVGRDDLSQVRDRCCGRRHSVTEHGNRVCDNKNEMKFEKIGQYIWNGNESILK